MMQGGDPGAAEDRPVAGGAVRRGPAGPGGAGDQERRPNHGPLGRYSTGHLPAGRGRGDYARPGGLL